MLMSQGAVTEEDISSEPQDAPSQALVGDVEYLSVVIGVCEDDAATRPDDPDELFDRGAGIGDVLQCAIGPCSMKGAAEERQVMGVGNGAVG